ncbi:hypothetical protein [Amycolatopsis sp. NPDC051903]|uniref:hypothetical protein n=1 Tax=Amycolatopsis sp. NPDC051903 TaxID=3363936 RepID=UPI003791BC87
MGPEPVPTTSWSPHRNLCRKRRGVAETGRRRRTLGRHHCHRGQGRVAALRRQEGPAAHPRTRGVNLAAAIAVGGATKTLTVAQRAQFAETSFTAITGQRLDLGLTGPTFPNGTSLRVRVLGPTGLTVFDSDVAQNGAATFVAPTAGNYRIVIAPAGFAAGSVVATLSEQLDAGTLQLNVPRTLSFSRAGKENRVHYAGTATQRLALNITGGARCRSSSTGTATVVLTFATAAVRWASQPRGQTAPRVEPSPLLGAQLLRSNVYGPSTISYEPVTGSAGKLIVAAPCPLARIVPSGLDTM